MPFLQMFQNQWRHYGNARRTAKLFKLHRVTAPPAGLIFIGYDFISPQTNLCQMNCFSWVIITFLVSMIQTHPINGYVATLC